MANDKDRRPVRPLTQQVAPIVKGFMRERHITQVMLATELDRDQSYVSERVSGKRPFTTDELDAIAKLADEEPRVFIAHIANALGGISNITPIRDRRVRGRGEAGADEKAAASKQRRDRGEETND